MSDRTATLSFKITPAMKARLEKAAREDSRSVSSLVLKILNEWADSSNQPAKARKR